MCRFFTIFEPILYILLDLDLVDDIDSSLSPSYEKSLGVDALHVSTVKNFPFSYQCVSFRKRFLKARGVSGKMPSLEDSTSLIEAFSREEIQEHVDLLDSGMDLSQERIQVRPWPKMSMASYASLSSNQPILLL